MFNLKNKSLVALAGLTIAGFIYNSPLIAQQVSIPTKLPDLQIVDYKM